MSPRISFYGDWKRIYQVRQQPLLLQNLHLTAPHQTAPPRAPAPFFLARRPVPNSPRTTGVACFARPQLTTPRCFRVFHLPCTPAPPLPPGSPASYHTSMGASKPEGHKRSMCTSPPPWPGTRPGRTDGRTDGRRSTRPKRPTVSRQAASPEVWFRGCVAVAPIVSQENTQKR